MTCPTDYSTTVWDHLLACWPTWARSRPVRMLLPWTPFADVPSEVGE